MGRLMDINELAEYLKLDKRTIYNWLHKKKISGIKVGRVWRFDKDIIDEWLKARMVPADPSPPEGGKKGKVKGR